MNGYHRHAKYRQGVYRRRQTRTVLLTALVVLLLLFVALLVAGSILSKRESGAPSDSDQVTDTAPLPSASLPAPPPRKALPVFIETSGSGSLSSRLNGVITAGYSSASLPLNNPSGSLLYRTDLSSSLGLTTAGAYNTTVAQAVTQGAEKGLTLCGTYYLTELAIEDELLRSVALAKSAAVIAEALRAGMDEVTLLVPDLSEAQISTLMQFSEDVRALAPDGALGCALSPSFLGGENSEGSVLRLSQGFHFLSLDLTHRGNEAPAAYVEAAMGSSGSLFFLLRYEMRMLLPDAATEGERQALIQTVEASWTHNWQILAPTDQNP